MRRFEYDDNEDHREDIDDFFNEMDFENSQYDDVLQQQLEIQQAQVGMIQREQDQRLLGRAVRIAEKSFLWRFKSVDTRLATIEKIYDRLLAVLNKS